MTATITPTIDGDFMALLPEPTDEEKDMLRQLLIEAQEARDPIVCWDSPGYPILDGHHRYDVCVNEGLPYAVRLLKIPDRDACKLWILRNQRGRRNLTPAQWSLIRGNEYKLLKGQQGGNHKSKSELPTLIDAADKVAADHNVDRSTVFDDNKFVDDVALLKAKSKKLASAVEHGEIPKAHVTAIADAPKATVKKLEQTEPKQLRKAASDVAKKHAPKPAKPKNGAQKQDPRLWGEIEGLLGKALNRTDDLNRSFEHSNLHRRLLAEIKTAMNTLGEWRRAVK
jgi:hypothetical protein